MRKFFIGTYALLLLFMTILTFTGCEEKSQNHETDPNQRGGILELNNGLQWHANVEVHEGINNIRVQIEAYNMASQKNALVLGESLDHECVMILRKSTMKGEAQTQLQNYMIPLRDLIVPLSTCKGNDCNKVIIQINDSLGSFNKYFKL